MNTSMGIVLEVFPEHDRQIIEQFQEKLESLEAWEMQELLFDFAELQLTLWHRDKVSINSDHKTWTWHDIRSCVAPEIEDLICGDLVDLSQEGLAQLQAWLALRYVLKIKN